MPAHARHDKTIRTLFSCALAAFLLLLTALAQAENPELKFYQLAGAIGPKAKIQSRLLVVDNDIYGTYFYESSRTLIPLRGSIAPDGTATIIESAKDGISTGTITGRFQDAGLSGLWQSPTGKRSLSFTTTAASGEYLYYLPMQELIAKAGAGEADAQYRLGVLFHHGQGVLPYDIKQAWRWYKKAAAQNHPQATYAIARLYEMGHGTNASIADADTWMKRAAEQGYEPAKQWLKTMHEKRKSRSVFDFMLEKERKPKSINFFTAMIEHDPATAERELKRIGTPTAQAYLAYMYYTGRIAAKDGQNKAEAIMKGLVPNYDRFAAKGLGRLLYGIKTLSSEASGITVPCFLHFAHPMVSHKAFSAEHGSSLDWSPERCQIKGILPDLLERNSLEAAISDFLILVDDHCGPVGSVRYANFVQAKIDKALAITAPQKLPNEESPTLLKKELKDWAQENRVRQPLHAKIFQAKNAFEMRLAAFYSDFFLISSSWSRKSATAYADGQLWVMTNYLENYCEKADQELAKSMKGKR